MVLRGVTLSGLYCGGHRISGPLLTQKTGRIYGRSMLWDPDPQASGL